MIIQKTLVTKFLILTIILTAALSVNYLFAAWVGPTQAPPGGNTSTPIHVGSTNQVKDGGLSLEGLSVFGGGYFQGNVGIGVVSPSEKLEVDGIISLKEQSSSPTAKSEYGKIYAKPITSTPSVPDSYTKLLLHMDSISFLDSSIGNHSVANNGVTISTTKSKFGGTSAYFNGNNSYLNIPDSADWDLGTDKFTLDFWAKVDTDKLDNTVLSYVQDMDNKWYLALNANTVQSDSDIRFYAFENDSPNYVDTVGHSFKGSWTHIAVVKETIGSGKLKIYINGNLVANNERDEDISIDLSFTGDLNIGVNLLSNDGYPHFFKGYIDELRISKGIARWTSNFTPPTVPYSASISGGGPYYMDSSGTEYSMIGGDGGGGGDTQIIETGTVYQTSPERTYNFSNTFTTIPVVVASSQDTDQYCATYNITISSFTLRCQNDAGAFSSSNQNYIAIGF